MPIIIKRYRKKKGGSYYFVYVKEGMFTAAVGRAKTKSEAEAKANKIARRTGFEIIIKY